MSKVMKAALVPTLRFPEFRDAPGWADKKLEDVCSINQGGTPDTSIAEYWNGSICWLTPAEMGKLESPFIDTTERKLTESGLQNCSSALLPIDSVILSTRAPIGHLIINRCEMAFNQGCKGLIPNNDLDFRFLYYSLALNKSHLQDLGAGNTFKELSGSALKAFKALFPIFAEQQKIAECLASLDALIGFEKERLEALKVFKKGLMQRLFPREDERVPQLRFPEFRGSGEWEIKPIGNEVEFLSGFPFDGADISQIDTGTRLLRGINITEGVVRHNLEIDRYYLKSTNELERFKIQTNDLVIGMDGSKVGKNSALILPEESGALLVQRVARLRAKSPTTINFIFQWINSPIFHEYVDRMNTSSGIPHISAKQIQEFTISFPSDEEQANVVGCLTSLGDLISTRSDRLDVLKSHKQGLMQQLFPSVENAK